MMNQDNRIGRQTALFGYIAESAQQNRFAATMNRRFKAEGDDAMCAPMNVRPDDFYFTVANMKKSQLKGAALGSEYRETVLELLDERSERVERYGYCDIVSVRAGRLVGDVMSDFVDPDSAHAADAMRQSIDTDAMTELLAANAYDIWHDQLHIDDGGFDPSQPS